MVNLVTDIKSLELETLKNLKSSNASNTLRAYKADYKDFTRFIPIKFSVIIGCFVSM